MHGKFVDLFSFLIILACLSNSADAQSEVDSSDEYKIKANYLYNLTQFIQWPNNEHLLVTHICIVGSHPILKQLKDLSNSKAKGKTIEIHYQADTVQLDQCHMLFIARDYADSGSLLSAASSSPILTVGEQPSFLDQGGIVSLVAAHNKVQLHINQSQAKNKGFEINSHLLEVAKTVK